MSNRDWISKKA